MKKFTALSIGVFLCVGVRIDALQAHHLVSTHSLQCNTEFPCPEGLNRRVHFWIQVFSLWNREQAIFHDSAVPDRVYSVVNTGQGCHDNVARKIKRERTRLQKQFIEVANKLDSKTTLKKRQKHIARMFDNDASSLRQARNTIRCQTGAMEGFNEGLKRFNRYSFMVDNILAQYKLPKDIRYLPFVESSYNPAAYSKAGAAGMWQIMPKTARLLGLELNATFDERLDPEAATHAAAKYLVKARKLLTDVSYEMNPNISASEINPFVITSYNYGVNGMRRAIRKIKPDYLKVINNYRSPAFQVAVKNFYASFLAARHIATHSNQYFDQITQVSMQKQSTYMLKNNTSITRIKKVFKLDESALKPLNLGLTRFIWHGWRMLPAGYKLRLPYQEDSYQSQITKLESLPVEVVAPGSDSYVVRKGNTACGIARALRVNCSELIRLNKLGRKALIRVGQKLSIPKKLMLVSNTSGKQANNNQAVPVSRNQSSRYRVKKGDSACEVADKFDVSCKELIQVNKLGRKAVIRIGQYLIIPGGQIIINPILDESNRYIVRKGDSACGIAVRFSVRCSDLKKLNRLKNKAVIYPGQRLAIPGYELPDTSATAARLAQSDTRSTSGALSNLLDTLPELRVTIDDDGGAPLYSVWVEPEETLKHYSDWLGIRSSSKIRSLNGLSSKTRIKIGRKVYLPITSGTMVSKFERSRTEYHQVLVESFKAHFELTRLENYKVRKGDSPWLLANNMEFPVWLLYRLNPVLKTRQLQIGQSLRVPVVRKN